MLAGIMFAGMVASAKTEALAIFGEPDCGKWLEGSSPIRKTWLLGYLSGLNSMDATRIDALDQLQSAQQAYVWMDNYCKENPLNGVAEGAAHLFFELANRSARAKQK